jgi:parvulin-like peptidyl-prolyl isomerase
MSENTRSPLLVVLIVLVGVLIVLQQTGWKLLGNHEANIVSAEVQPVAAEQSETGGGEVTSVDMSLDFEDMQALIKALSPQQREQLLASAELFAQLVEQEKNFRSLLKGALGSSLPADPAVKLLMDRAANRILAESYLAVLLNKNIQGKMPTDQDVENYFVNNPEQFEVPDRVYLSQIFFSTTEGNDEAVMTRANELYQQLTSGKKDFADLARKYSEHASKANGGEMGPISVSGMLPEIRDALRHLKEDSISQPIKTQTGIHIIRKGGVIKTEKITLEQARTNINNALVQDAQNKVRIAILTKVNEKFPATVSTDDIETWRTRLKQAE